MSNYKLAFACLASVYKEISLDEVTVARLKSIAKEYVSKIKDNKDHMFYTELRHDARALEQSKKPPRLDDSFWVIFVLASLLCEEINAASDLEQCKALSKKIDSCIKYGLSDAHLAGLQKRLKLKEHEHSNTQLIESYRDRVHRCLADKTMLQEMNLLKFKVRGKTLAKLLQYLKLAETSYFDTNFSSDKNELEKWYAIKHKEYCNLLDRAYRSDGSPIIHNKHEELWRLNQQNLTLVSGMQASDIAMLQKYFVQILSLAKSFFTKIQNDNLRKQSLTPCT